MSTQADDARPEIRSASPGRTAQRTKPRKGERSNQVGGVVCCWPELHRRLGAVHAVPVTPLVDAGVPSVLSPHVSRAVLGPQI